MKRYISELIGTMILVLFGCGTAALTLNLFGANGFMGVLTIAIAFGLTIVATAYVIGNVSGCHINPAVSLGMLIDGRMNVKDFVCYVVAQIIGGIVGILILMAIIGSAPSLGGVAVTGLGADGFGSASMVGLTMVGALLVEIVLTFVFVFTVLGVTDKVENGSVAGLVIGFTLTLVHILGIPLTGTSVNPARSIAPALFTGGLALQQLWVFIVGPLVGAAIAALIYKYIVKDVVTA